MTSNVLLPNQGRRLLQIGIVLSLLLYSSLDGFVIPYLRSQRIGLSVHALSALQSVLLVLLGLLWPKLALGNPASRVAFWCLTYSTFSILAAYTVAALWGVGIETIRLLGELPHGLTRGTTFQETLIKGLACSAAPTGLAAFVIILWGLRGR